MLKLEVNVTCPGCKAAFKQKVESMHPGATRSCPRCGQSIRFTGDDGRKVQRSLDDLERAFKSLSRR